MCVYRHVRIHVKHFVFILIHYNTCGLIRPSKILLQGFFPIIRLGLAYSPNLIKVQLLCFFIIKLEIARQFSYEISFGHFAKHL